MIVSNDIKPERQVYYLGALLLEVLEDASGDSVDLFTAFESMNVKRTVSASSFVLALDWLFLIGAISNDGGRILKCF